MRFEPVVQGLVGQTQNRRSRRYTLSRTDASDCFQLKFQRIPRPVCLSYNTSHKQDYASRYGIHFPGARTQFFLDGSGLLGLLFHEG